MKRKHKIIIILIALLIVIASIMWYMYSNSGDDAYDLAIRGLNEEFNADIMVYGDDVEFRKGLKYRRIDDINETTLSSDISHGYKAIYVLDESSKNTVTDEQWLLMKTYVEEKGYDMYYIGEQYLDDLQRLGFTSGYYNDDERSLEYIGSNKVGNDVQQNEVGNLYAEHGLYREGDNEGDDEAMQYQLLVITYDHAKASIGEE